MINDQQLAEEEAPYYRIQSVDRTLTILQCFVREKRPLGVSELARMMSLNRSAVHRFLLTLKDHGYVTQVRDSDRYSIGPAAFELGAVFTNSTDLTAEGRKVLIELVRQTGCLAHLGILDQGTVLYLLNVEPDRGQYLFGAVGQRRMVYNTALGKSLTAWLPEDRVDDILDKCSFEQITKHTIGTPEQYKRELEQIRQEGIAFDREESSIGAFCISAPVRDKWDDVIAAISISAYGLSEEKIREMGLVVKSSAAQLSRRLGHMSGL
ncbi:IclR family transcriptional regulator [Paenibacillus aurantius]|uniref:Glycerol operon regulatory protein n=1 Tax=Paenibacillus aurantius TaxID=2918900 RepID=A0AA96RHE8_9BACL|nr:IclR family transcriptional regulator [Paenibacillus aurantius]WNQ13288.1 IclR family transcriptional regulator [Paenibacillus aurantius]